MKEMLFWCLEHAFEFVFMIFAFMLILWMWWNFENRAIVITKYSYSLKSDFKDLKGFKIIQISDLHSMNFGKNQSQLISKIREQKPDMIFITGDIVDRADGSVLKEVEDLLSGIYQLPANVAYNTGNPFVPVFYVTGNHEIGYQYLEELKLLLKKYNLSVLNNEFVDVKINDCPNVRVIGVMDWGFQRRNNALSGEKWHKWIDDHMIETIKHLKDESQSTFHLLLSHRPEKFDVYLKSGVDLVFTGHAHGGQIRLPFLGSVLAPNQGFFPKYAQGMHTKVYRPCKENKYKDENQDENQADQFETKTTMIVSRGLGGTKKFPTRINNRPELISVEFQ